jgi:hypothetical protein
MKKHLLGLCIVLFAFAAKAEESSLNESFSLYEKFKYSNSMNWSDCFNFKITPGIDFCPGGFIYPPYPTLTLNYSYNDVVAMVEVVPDPWRSYLYKESLYNFNSKADDGIASKIGVSPTIGAGYTGQGKGSATEQVQQHKLETHVWAVGDLWRLKTSDKVKSCLSLTCKNEDYTGCILSVVKTVVKAGEGISDTIASVNSNQSASGKGQGIQNGENGQVTYENGEVYEERNVYGGKDDSRIVGKEYVQVREAGNYGDSTFGKLATVATSESVIPGMTNAEIFQESVAVAKNPTGYIVGKAVSAGSSAIGSAISSGIDSATEGAKSFIGTGNASPLPKSTTKGGKVEQEGNYDVLINKKTSNNPFYYSDSGDDLKPGDTYSTSAISVTGKEVFITGKVNEDGSVTETVHFDDDYKSSSESGNDVSNTAMGNNSSGNQSATKQIMGGVANNGMNKMIEIIDRVTYFNVVELTMQMIATVLPISIHPIYMSERHGKASSDGGFFWSSIFQTFADKGAGLVMPLFCMSKMLSMSIDGVASMLVSADFNILGKLGGIGSFIENRCVGSWGPLEPRVTLIGAGDPFVAAGLASVRGLNVAQNTTGSMFNQTINNTPFSQLKFNLDWPHQSSCYGFQGFSGLSRGWTTPLGGAIDNVSSAVQSGDMSKIGSTAFDTAVSPARKQGGYVFTYWRSRKCKYLWACDIWKGDTGL